jgi:hypothetical protein
MDADETRPVFVRLLLDKIREDPFPSREQLDLVEESIPPDMVPEYVQVLVDKAAADPFPSNEMLHRIQRMSGG